MSAIELAGLTKKYGSVVAVESVSLEVEQGSRHALIGPNGAGKSTLFAMVAGTVRPSSGSVRFFGENVSRLSDHQRARRGLAKTFQHSSMFSSMTVVENVLLATERRHGRPTRPVGRHARRAHERAAEVLSIAGLSTRANDSAAALSHGERRQLEVALALALEPRLVLFDEPTAGMSVAETDRFVEMVECLPPEITLLIIEHDLDVVFSIASRVSVLHLGKLLADGRPEEIRASELVQQTYLGAPPTEFSSEHDEEVTA
jgi:branched-chain amino acid transport system ATP-binding protein